MADDALSITATMNEPIEPTIKIIDDSQVVTHWQYSPYSKDAVTRKAKALQDTQIGKINDAFISESTAKKLKLSDGDLYHGVPVSINETVADGCVFVHTHHSRKG